MNEKIMRELLDEVLSALERLEAQNLAMMEFLKGQKKGAEKLAPYLEQAEKTSSVKWMASRARLNHLLDAAVREAEQAAEKHAEKAVQPVERAEKDGEGKDAKSDQPADKNEKVEGSGKTSETKTPEPSSQTAESSSSEKSNTVEAKVEKQPDTKPSSEKQKDHPTESAA